MLEPGKALSRVEVCSVAAARRVAAMLDLDPEACAEGNPLPRGWQFILLGADTRRCELRGDGFPGLGVPMPDLGLPRLLLGGRTVSYRHDISIGAPTRRVSSIKSLTRKSTKSGPMAVVTVEHELYVPSDEAAAVVETQTYIMLAPREGVLSDDRVEQSATLPSGRSITVVPDETLLFQYSALGFNTHKIHLDKAYARDVEGFPDLVVNGGLATLLLTEFLRKELALIPVALRVRHIAPLFCGRLVTLTANVENGIWRLQAFDDKHRLAVDMEVAVQ